MIRHRRPGPTGGCPSRRSCTAMEKFTTLTGVAAPLPLVNVDTDMIIPKQFLKTVQRTGLSKGLFYEMRFDEQGRPKEGFVLDQPAYRHAKILDAGENSGDRQSVVQGKRGVIK